MPDDRTGRLARAALRVSVGLRVTLNLGARIPRLLAVRDDLPAVTVVIPAPPDLNEVLAVPAARALRWPAEKLEILLVRGRHPAVQRNVALRQAQGELIYFLDSDSVPAPDALERAWRHLADPAVQIVGGPSLCPPEAPALEQVFAVVLASELAFGPSRARYAPVGQVRLSSEKELILCNLVARRQALLELGGFDELLYPNEENALMDLVQRRGGKLVYDPALRVWRRPRGSLGAFVRMLRTYGRGRAEQFRRHPTAGSALNFVPPLFVVYLLAVPVLVALRMSPWLLAPLGVYALAVSAQTIVSAKRWGLSRSLGAAPLVVLTHLAYGLGFWRGFLGRLKWAATRPSTDVTVQRIGV